MSEELNQRDLINNPEKIGDYDFRNIGSTTLSQLKTAKIISSKNYKDFEKRKPDAIISIPSVVKSKIKTTIAVIENKDVSKFKTPKQKQEAIQQGLEVAEVLEAKILIVTDTIETLWINALNGEEILDEKGRVVKEKFDKNNPDLAILIQKIYESIDKNNSHIREAKFVDPTDLAKRIWQILWSISGATPESCLYSFVELFIFKYLSDLKILDNDESFEKLINSYSYKTPEEVISYYAKNVRLHIKEQLFPKGIDGTTIINGTVFVNNEDTAIEGRSTAFEKILREFESYGKLDNIHPDFKSKLFESFLKESISKKNWGQYFTPLRVVQSIIKMSESDINESSIICDPAGGVGKFLLEAVKPRLNELYKIKNGKLEYSIKLAGYDIGFDKDEQKTIILAKANMLIYFSELLRKNRELTSEFAKLFNDTFELKKNSILGTLASPEKEVYTLILSNPPYVTSGSSNIKEEIKRKGLQSYYKVNGIGVEGLFMEWIIRSLKPGGKAFVVVPDGIFNRQNDKNLRQFILDECIVDGIISLPVKTFFTTPKKTYILAITKKKNKADKQTDPVFTYLVSEIGESRDNYRFDIEQDDLSNAVSLFNFFKGNKTGFGTINTDKRCKIQPINIFAPDTHWSVDRWWSKEEQIELGIVEEDKIFTIEDFTELINDVSETLKDYSGLLKEVSLSKKKVDNFQEIDLSNKAFFELFIGKRLVKKDLIKITDGYIPIYSANVKIPIAYHTESNISNFDNNFVIWGIDGDFEFNFIPKNTPFVSTDHCGAIRILNDDILPEFLMIQLDKVKHRHGFDRGLRSSLKNMKEVKIEIPFDEKGKIDVEKQREIIEKYEYVSSLKSKISDYQKQVENLNVEVINHYPYKTINVSSLFEVLSIPKKIFKKDIQEKGNIPVYSSQIENKGIVGYSNIEMFLATENKPLITFGDHTRVFYIRKKPFAILDNVKVLKIKTEYENIVDLEFLIYTWREKIENIGYSRYWKYAKEINISIPINSKGEFDLEKQKEIAEKYRKVEEIKKAISAELEKISKIEMDYE